MLLILLVLAWAAFLVPMAVRRLRDRRSERSIEQFHVEHDSMRRHEAVAPVHRLDDVEEYYETPSYGYEDVPAPRAPRRPHLRVVRDDDTYQSLESTPSWDEWADAYEFDVSAAPVARRGAPSSRPLAANRYASAYSSTPRGVVVDQPAPRRRSMRARRRVMFLRTVAAALVLSVAAVVTGSSLVLDLAVVAWLAVVGFVALALYAVSQGYLSEGAVGLRRAHQSASVVELPPYATPPRSGYAPRPQRAASAVSWEEWAAEDDDDGWGRDARYALG